MTAGIINKTWSIAGILQTLQLSCESSIHGTIFDLSQKILYVILEILINAAMCLIGGLKQIQCDNVNFKSTNIYINTNITSLTSIMASKFFKSKCREMRNIIHFTWLYWNRRRVSSLFCNFGIFFKIFSALQKTSSWKKKKTQLVCQTLKS